METEAQFMKEAIAEARRAMGRTHPNPAVGAVIVHQGKTVARGCTQPAGQNHAEIIALREFSGLGLVPDDQTTLYVTLEPCSTQGRTGPCTDAIITSGIRKVVVGCLDANPKHDGRGLEILREAGISVTAGVLAEDCEELNLIFDWRMRNEGPFIAAKIATTLDGRMATRGGLSKWITGPAARQNVHFWRHYFPAIGVGAGTILADDPALTSRIDGEPETCPLRFVFDRNLVTFRDRLPRVYTDEWKDRTIIIANQSRMERIRELEERHGLRFWPIEDKIEDRGLNEFIDRCREEEISGFYLEGGAQLLSSFLKIRKIHYLFAYRSPKLLADDSGLSPFTGYEPVTLEDTIQLRKIRHESFGPDQLMRGFVVYPGG